jgi:hypothetical protein
MAATTIFVTALTSAYQLVADGQSKVHLQAGAGSDLRVAVAASLPAANESDYFVLRANEAITLDGLASTDNVYVRADKAKTEARAIGYTAETASGIAPAGSVGTPAVAGVEATEYGSEADHTTVLTLTAFAVGTSGDNANKAIGALLYTFPAGIIQIDSAEFIGLGITAAISVTTDTPEVGLGTTQASAVQATLGAVAATAENISEGGDTTNVAPDVAGTATINSSKKPTVASGDDGPLVIPAASAHTVYLNIADGWADVTAAGAVTAAGVVVLNWKKLT